MKTAIIMLSAVSFVLSAGAATARADGDSGTLTATVDTVTIAQEEGEYSSIAVIDEYGVTIIFDIAPDTAICGPTNAPMPLADIKQDDAVEIKYDNLSGGLGLARSIKLTEQPPE